MSFINSKCRANFDEWLDNITNKQLGLFVFGRNVDGDDFGSKDFRLVNIGISTGEPTNCHMIEARINSKTKDKQLRKLINTSGYSAKDSTRLAFVLFPTSMVGHCQAIYIRQALRESPIEDKMIVNKVHVQWSADVQWEGDQPCFAGQDKPFVFEKIPFAGYDVDGKQASKKGKNPKKK